MKIEDLIKKFAKNPVALEIIDVIDADMIFNGFATASVTQKEVADKVLAAANQIESTPDWESEDIYKAADKICSELGVRFVPGVEWVDAKGLPF